MIGLPPYSTLTYPLFPYTPLCRYPVSSVSLIFSMPEGTDPEKVLGAVRALAHAELSDNHDYVLALHTDTPRPHVHLTVQAEGLDRNRFNPRPVQLNRF